MIQEGTYQFLGFFDGFAILLWLIILFYLITSTYNKNKNKTYYKYYKIGFYAKFFAAISFSIIYIYKYEGGDTTAYWDTAQKFNNLFYEKPLKFFEELFNINPMSSRYYSFDMSTGVPPNWIYLEKEGLFTSKIYCLVSFLTFRSYFAMTFICAYFSFKASWKLFELGIKFNAASERNMAIATLFLPSTAFWCTGISKDTIIYVCVIYTLHNLFKYFDTNEKKGLFFYTKLFVFYFLITNIRDFMLLTAIGPFIFAVGIKYSNRPGNSNSTKYIIQTLLISLVFIGMSLFFKSEKAVEITQEAQVIQSDLKNNQEYGGARYDLGISEFSPLGMIKAMPISIFTSFYRPFLWESGSLFIFISALETFLLLILSINLIFRTGIVKFVKKVRENEFLIAALIFSLILGFFAGYTSGLFGVLVRFKAPLLPFLFILLTMEINNSKKIKKKSI